MPSVLTLIHDLAEAVALGDPERVGRATVALAGRIGVPAAVAVARSLATEARPLAAVLPGDLAPCA